MIAVYILRFHFSFALIGSWTSWASFYVKLILNLAWYRRPCLKAGSLNKQ